MKVEETKTKAAVVNETTTVVVPKEIVTPSDTIFPESIILETPKVEKEKPEQKAEPKKELSIEEKIIAFIDSRNAGEVRLNDFLKSVYPLPQRNEPPAYVHQHASKQLRVLLAEMQVKGQLTLVNDLYTKLGQGYYEGDGQLLKHYNITNVEIIAKK